SAWYLTFRNTDPATLAYVDPTPASSLATVASAGTSGKAADSTAALNQVVAALAQPPAGPAASTPSADPASVSASSASSAPSAAATTNAAALPAASVSPAGARHLLFADWGEKGLGDVLEDDPVAV